MATWVRSLNFLKEFGTMGWVPRFNMSSNGVFNEIDVSPITGAESSCVGILTDGYGVIKGPSPPVLMDRVIDQHWSMDLSFYSWRDPKACYRVPWLNPQCDALVSRKIGHGSALNASRVSKNGVVTQHRGGENDIRISPSLQRRSSKPISMGLVSNISRRATQVWHLNGLSNNSKAYKGVSFFRILPSGICSGSLATGKWRRAREVRGAVKRSLSRLSIFGRPATDDEISGRTETILNQAVEARVFRVGLEFQCSRCKRHNWYAVSEFDDTYNCKSCFARELTPRLDWTTWNYMSDGFYRSTNKLDGNISVLLALNFINYVFDHTIHYVPSFDYSDESGPHELDFAIVASEFLHDRVDLIFGEAKSGADLNGRSRQKSNLSLQRREPTYASAPWPMTLPTPTKLSSVNWWSQRRR